MARLLRGNLRAWLGCGNEASIEVRPHRGKPDLLKKLPTLLQGYALLRRRGRDVRVLVLVDQDTDDCAALKRRLEDIARGAGPATRQTARGGPFAVVNRSAVRELENWYLGDWGAVRSAFPKVKADVPTEYRHNADKCDKETSDVFADVLRRNGVRNESKPDWAKRIGPHLSPEANRSPSFGAFLQGARSLLKEQS